MVNYPFLPNREIERENTRRWERKKKRLLFFFFSNDWFNMLPTWPITGNSLKSHKRPKSKQVKSMFRFISGYYTHQKNKGGYYRMTTFCGILVLNKGISIYKWDSLPSGSNLSHFLLFFSKCKTCVRKISNGIKQATQKTNYFSHIETFQQSTSL